MGDLVQGAEDAFNNVVTGVGNLFGGSTPEVSGLGVGAASDPAMATGIGGYSPITSASLGAPGTTPITTGFGGVGGGYGGGATAVPITAGIGGGYGSVGNTGVTGSADIALKPGAGLAGAIAPPSSATPASATSAAGLTPSFDTQPNLPTAGGASPAAPTSTPTPTPSGGGGGAGGTGGGSTLSKFFANPGFGTFGDVIAANPGLAIGGAGLAASALRSNSKLPQEGTLLAQEAQAGKAGQQLTQPLLTGKLPAGAQSIVDQSLASNIAAIRSQYAGMGLSGSSMETEAIQGAEAQAAQLTFQIAQNMAQTGLAETQLSSGIAQNMMQAQLNQDNELSNAIAEFAKAAAGGGPTINIGR